MGNKFIYVLNKNEVPHYIGETLSPSLRLTAHKRRWPDTKMEVIDEVPAKKQSPENIAKRLAWRNAPLNNVC